MGLETRSFSWLCPYIEEQRLAFAETGYPLSVAQKKRFHACYILLKENVRSQASRSAQRQSRRVKVQSLLADVFTAFGAEVFLLCTLAVSVSDLARVDQLGLLSKLGSWWEGVEHPGGLSIVATEVCDTFSVPGLLQSISRTGHSRYAGQARTHAPETSSSRQQGLSATSITECGADSTSLRNPTLEGNCSYMFFSFMTREAANNVPEPFRTAMHRSRLWSKEEDRGGLAITNCLSMYLPSRGNEDAVVLIRLGYSDAWQLSNLFGLGDVPEQPASKGNDQVL